MPAVSAKQKKLMDAAAHSPAFAKKVGIPTKVAKEFSRESRGLKFKEGGQMKESKSMMKKEVSFMKKKGAPKSMIKHEMAEAGMEAGGRAKKLPTPKEMGSLGMKAGGKVKKMAAGDMVEEPMMPTRPGPRVTRDPSAPYARTMKSNMGRVSRFAAGGLATGHKSADGIASKGKTRGTKVAMAGAKKMRKGGYC
jgi:hypothetical protein